MTIRVQVGTATVDIASHEVTNRVDVTVPVYQPDHLLHAAQRALEATGMSCEHVQSLLSDTRKHLRAYQTAGRSCPMTHVDIVAEDLRSFADELEKETDESGSRWHGSYTEMLRHAAQQLERLQQTQQPMTIAGRIQRIPPDPGVPQAGPVPDEGGPAYSEISPALKDSLRHLIREYGAAGVERTLRLMLQNERGRVT